MLGLPKSTELVKPLPKKAMFEKFKPSAIERKLFDEQINRMSIVAEISPQTVAVSASEDVSAIYVIHMMMKTTKCDQKNIILLAKLIDQRMLFILQYGGNARLAAYRAKKVIISESMPLGDWKLSLNGFDLGAIWENAIAQIGGIDISDGKSLDVAIIENERSEKIHKQIETLEKSAMNEQQPRRKWDLAEKIKRLKQNL